MDGATIWDLLRLESFQRRCCFQKASRGDENTWIRYADMWKAEMLKADNAEHLDVSLSLFMQKI